MHDMRIYWKKYALLSTILMIVMLLFSIIFWEERMYFLDPNWMTFHFLKNENIVIQESRYGSFITHIFPVIGIKLQFSLECILQLYNASFFVFFCITSLLLYRWKQYVLNVLLLLYFTFFVGDVFFWPSNEVHQGVTWAFLGLGLYFRLEEKQSKALWLYLLAILFLALGIVSHFLVLFAVLPIWIFSNFQKTGAKTALTTKHLYIGLAVIFSLLAFKILITSGNGYDKSKLTPIRDITFQSSLKAFTTPHALDFYKLLSGRFIFATATFVVTAFLLIKRKSYWSLSVFLIGILGFWIMINLVYPSGMDRSLWFYMESEYQVMSIMLFAPLLYLAKPLQFELRISKVLILLGVLSFSERMISSHQLFSKRLENLDKVIAYTQAKDITKAILIMDEEQSKKYFLMAWGLPVETLFRSTINENKGITIKPLSSNTDWHIADVYGKKELFLSSFTRENKDWLPQKYLQLDTANTYKVIYLNDILTQLEPLY